MNQLLENNSVLLLFVVISSGALLGSVKIRKKSLGASMVLFTGLFFGFLNPVYQLPELVLVLGLSVFIYSIGLNSGPIFFESYRRNGMRDFVFIFSMLVIVGLAAALLWFLFGFSAASISGMYSGISTNTPAFAAVLDYIQNIDRKVTTNANQDLVVAFTLAYPIGVAVTMLVVVLMEKLLKVDYKAEYRKLRTSYPLDNNLTSAAVKITKSEVTGKPLRELSAMYDWNIKFGRIKQEDQLSLSNWDTSLSLGDEVMILGSKEDIDIAVGLMGERQEEKLSHERSEFDTRRIFMSNPKLAGRTIASLNLPEQFNGMIMRIRRGDNDMLAQGNTVLELGDRIRFIAKRADLTRLSEFFGDSYQESSKINLFSFGFGLSIGLLIGSFAFPIGGGLTLKLGIAGGPLIAGLILGALRRTGPVLWTAPYSTSVVLQQLGLMFLLAYVGVNNGAIFFDSLNLQSLGLLGASTFLCIFSCVLILLVGYKWVKIPFSLLLGMVSNQPAVLEFNMKRAGSKIPEFGFAMILPIAIILKIIIAQLLYIILR